MTPARQDESTFLHNPINPNPNFSVGPKVGERPLRQDTASKRSIKNRRMKAALNPAYRLEALMGFRQEDVN